MGRLTAAFVRSVRHRGGARKYADHHYDQHGLYLQVLRSGTKQWVQRLVLDGERHDYGLGGYEFVTLGQAREQAFENARAARAYRRARARGERPEPPPFEASRRATVARRQGQPAPHAGAPTFEQAFEACIAERSRRWKNPATDLRSWRATLHTHLAGIKPLAVARVDVDDLRGALSDLAPKTADKVLARAGTVFEWAIAGGQRPDNPARALRKTWAGLKREEPVHHKAMPYHEVPAFFARLCAGGVGADARGALALVVLTGLRSGEARGARWEEVLGIDSDSPTLAIPAARMKDGREHRVPLSAQAVEVLRAAGPKGEGRIFSSPQGKDVLDNTLRVVMAGQGGGYTVHGLRSSLRTWCSEATPPVAREVAEACLAHRAGSSVEQAYARSTMLERRRREVMEPWGAFVAGAGR